ncbi:polysaccharide lyase [Rhodopirellula bahusiensis]|uniref:polysaccharide lyase n=1 Tax=Rhodopirellula bahusiensis TaxID=2014065 RepID=UPI0032653B8C
MTRLSLTVIALAITFGCEKPGNREEELTYLREILPAELLDLSHLDLPSRDSIAKTDTADGTHLGLRIHPGQSKTHGGMRAEVSLDYPFKPDDIVRYTWKFRLPGDFASDAPQNRWWVIGQWHDQPDRTNNETWATHPSYSPPISIGIAEIENRLAIGLSYGTTLGDHKQAVSNPIPIQRGTWYTVQADIRWSPTENGSIELSLLEKPDSATVMQGPNMNNPFQHYLKIGMYRHPGIQTENWIHIDQIDATHLTASEPMQHETALH